ncbi:MBL fold metallo-hydrolase [Salinicola aestuarinus]|uniref:MBL fold metallo-hydrolase n=1 Tax=Salinicola aestuarinus TaxID=1949082 RepID=UPI0013004DF3|nr:MBL fold metallo-hydrolase [Salinicola aestuarinus]
MIVDDKKVFPNAEVYASQADFDYFLDPDNGAESEGLEAVNFSAAKKTFSIYEDRIESFEAPAQIMPGIRAIPASGHSPGHTVFMVESEGQKLLLMGDLVHVPQMQFAHPEYSMEFDLNEDQGEVTRKTLLDDAAEQHFWVAGAHLPFPATGHIQSKGTGFVYLPAESAASKP